MPSHRPPHDSDADATIPIARHEVDAKLAELAARGVELPERWDKETAAHVRVAAPQPSAWKTLRPYVIGAVVLSFLCGGLLAWRLTRSDPTAPLPPPARPTATAAAVSAKPRSTVRAAPWKPERSKARASAKPAPAPKASAPLPPRASASAASQVAASAAPRATASAAPRASASASSTAALASKPVSPPKPASAQACLATYFPPDTFKGGPDAAAVCAADKALGGSLALKAALVVASGGGRKVSPAMREWSRLGWYEMALFAMMRGRCCTKPGALKADIPLVRPCKLEASLAALQAAAKAGTSLKAPLAAFDKAARCVAYAGAAPYYQKNGPPYGGGQKVVLEIEKRRAAP